MSKKHFEALAAALRNCEPHEKDTDALGTWRLTCKHVADVCAAHNPNFDRARFLKVCGMEG